LKAGWEAVGPVGVPGFCLPGAPGAAGAPGWTGFEPAEGTAGQSMSNRPPVGALFPELSASARNVPGDRNGSADPSTAPPFGYCAVIPAAEPLDVGFG